ncbi:N-acetyl sugar amidotransferase, partial [Prochlorococcus sp. AH-736-E15]|nr:N-acetyl sugar amidotransferase [Prochlorococcus sp. AH-736-E15]
MKYCKSCVMPDTKPGLKINKEGICSACESIQNKFLIDWDKRNDQLSDICDAIRDNNNSDYDCIVPVSGGKDSNTQVFVMSKLYKLRVLAVTAMAHLQTEEGIENLNSLISQHNVDLLKINVKPSVLQKIRRNGFLKIGNPNYAEHRLIFSSVARASIFYNVPLVVWGEDIASEFGGNQTLESKEEGSAKDLISNDLFREAEFHELIDESISDKDLFFYNHPDIKELKEKSIKSIYLSHFQWWDGIKHFYLAKNFGFKERQDGLLSGNIIAYDNIDEKLCEIHKWLQFMK